MDVTTLLVRNFIGLLDVESSMKNIQAALEAKAKSEKLKVLEMSAILCDIFDANPEGMRIPMPTLVPMVMGKMKVPAYLYSETVAEVEAFIRSSTTTFNISRGRNGGVMRVVRD